MSSNAFLYLSKIGEENFSSQIHEVLLLFKAESQKP